jgi:hypothetical protein
MQSLFSILVTLTFQLLLSKGSLSSNTSPGPLHDACQSLWSLWFLCGFELSSYPDPVRAPGEESLSAWLHFIPLTPNNRSLTSNKEQHPIRPPFRLFYIKTFPSGFPLRSDYIVSLIPKMVSIRWHSDSSRLADEFSSLPPPCIIEFWETRGQFYSVESRTDLDLWVWIPLGTLVLTKQKCFRLKIILRSFFRLETRGFTTPE